MQRGTRDHFQIIFNIKKSQKEIEKEAIDQTDSSIFSRRFSVRRSGYQHLACHAQNLIGW